MTQLSRVKVKVTLQGHVIYLSIRVCSIYPKPFDRFSLNFTQMFLLVRQCAEHMTQLPRLNVKATGQGHGLILEFHIGSTSPEPFWQFSLMLQCAEPITWLPRLKVTGQGNDLILLNDFH